MTLLVGAGLLIRSALLIQKVDPGFDGRGVYTARVVLPSGQYADSPEIVRFYEQLRREAAEHPAIGTAAVVSAVPLSGSNASVGVTREGHFAPIPDPLAGYRGMSWLTPVIRETMADSAATLHKLKFFENAATPNMVVKFDPATTTEDAREAIEVFEQEHSGVFNAYRTAYLLGGADATVVGANLHEMDFKSTQGAGETRICAAAGVHPTVVGVSEGLQGSSLNAGNFDTAARLTANKTLRPNWRNFAGSLEVIVPPPNGSRLWYDDRDVPFLTENIKDRAEVLAQNASSIRTLSDAGAEWDPVIDAVVSGDLRRLRGAHSGLFSVQLLPPNETGSEADDDAAVARQPAAREVREMVALSEFWAASGFAEGTHVSPGQRFSSDDPVVRAFDQFFEPTSPASAAVRCHGCHSLLAELATAPYRFTCPKCKAATAA
jgi:hypothetical protein